jgi:hypothetical protein
MRLDRPRSNVGPTTLMLPVLVRPLSSRADVRRGSSAAVRLAGTTLLLGLDRLRSAEPLLRPATWAGIAVSERVTARRKARRRAARLRQARRSLVAIALLGSAAAVARAVSSR